MLKRWVIFNPCPTELHFGEPKTVLVFSPSFLNDEMAKVFDRLLHWTRRCILRTQLIPFLKENYPPICQTYRPPAIQNYLKKMTERTVCKWLIYGTPCPISCKAWNRFADQLVWADNTQNMEATYNRPFVMIIPGNWKFTTQIASYAESASVIPS